MGDSPSELAFVVAHESSVTSCSEILEAAPPSR